MQQPELEYCLEAELLQRLKANIKAILEPEPENDNILDVLEPAENKADTFTPNPEITSKPYYFNAVGKVRFLEYLKKAESHHPYLKLLRILEESENIPIDSLDTFKIERCTQLNDITEKECEDPNHLDIIYHYCGLNRLCPRDIARETDRRTESILDKYEYFKIRRWKHRVYTVPENLRELVSNDKNKLAQAIYNTEWRYHNRTLVAGILFIHPRSTEEPYRINPHCEVFIGDIGIKEISIPCYYGKRKQIRIKSPYKQIVKESYDPETHESAISIARDRDLSGDIEVSKKILKTKTHLIHLDLWESEKDLIRLKEIYKEELESAYGVKLDIVDIFCEYLEEEDYDKMRFHRLPYALKPPVVPHWVNFVAKDYGDSGSITYSDGVSFSTITTIEEFSKAFQSEFYSKSNFHSIRYFGFLATSCWKKYYKILFNQSIPDKPKPNPDDEFYCIHCGKPLIKIITNQNRKFEWYRDHKPPDSNCDIVFNPTLEIDILEKIIGSKTCGNCAKYPCLKNSMILRNDRCHFSDNFQYKEVLCKTIN